MTAKKPTKLKVQEGTFRKDRAVKNELTAQTKSDFSPPEHLNSWGRNLWVQIASQFSHLQMLTVLDDGSLYAMCNEFGVYCECCEMLRTQGLQITKEIYSRKGDVVGTELVNNPLRRLASDAYRNYRSMAVEFGLTPVSRSRISMDNKLPNNDPFAEY